MVPHSRGQRGVQTSTEDFNEEQVYKYSRDILCSWDDMDDMQDVNTADAL